MNHSLPLQTWKRFVKEGALDEARLRTRIYESWHRCKKAQVSPYLNKGTFVLNEKEFENQIEKNRRLLQLAQPHLQQIHDFIHSLGMMALIIDSDGYVLQITGHEHTVSKADRINFIEGVRWTEEAVGTNAIGTALKIEEPVVISGYEHYAVASHTWNCFAAPIRDEEGKVVGVIDVSCPSDRSHPYVLGMVTTIAYAIEKDFHVQAKQDELELMQQSMGLLSKQEPALICNQKGKVIGASSSIYEQLPHLVGCHMDELRLAGYKTQLKAPIFSKHDPMLAIGYFVRAERMEKSKKPFSMANTHKPFLFKGEPGVSKSFRQTLNLIQRVAKTDATVYLFGETGTGKEVTARTIHENSSRHEAPFVAINCGAIPKDLIGSELFGYVEGAFTGARRQGYKGKFEQAHGGTVFLDEIGEIPEAMQIALLRVLQERVITPIGGTKEIEVDIRLITATNKDLRQLVREGNFREDLYYRLNVFPIALPSLRERKEDIPHLIRYFCQQNGWELNLSKTLMAKLMSYHWPGNIRELLNILERIFILSDGGEREVSEFDSLLFEHHKGTEGSENEAVELTGPSANSLPFRERILKEKMIRALRDTNGNVTLAAKELDMPRSTFYKRLKKYNLS
ncbi:sigma-54-dependent Fis family transcriptional regulator [Halalkalibacterium halodurans]|uniref:Transcriptional activator of the acetoin dehydrogenase operon n=1 Tax=Halalkalibacterium halodurans (strain ATCC BAA-125 / DSM 18197 / FERM 7344 / JCM 9153 / C-125) TaxID=272558 RepID=Q9KBU8_HALH5|nr:sigma-54-dependent Fis family transcriptional regulator [Halalkalibacterium halodurans]MED4124988.1 sigma-54-dependent Fis family transcriptional regulator [Halalkalibacterium halodurans]MED4171821.1 sigma-54-dependent Fis family transcriptional regulator [Halalkalibacterium halodurans]BAB05545.1 transcriptional activator of the acetoin dehydrogenase operon [Halalkalibacterium halodurans C-125]